MHFKLILFDVKNTMKNEKYCLRSSKGVFIIYFTQGSIKYNTRI